MLNTSYVKSHTSNMSIKNWSAIQSKASIYPVSKAPHESPLSWIHFHFSTMAIKEYCVLKLFLQPDWIIDSILSNGRIKNRECTYGCINCFVKMITCYDSFLEPIHKDTSINLKIEHLRWSRRKCIYVSLNNFNREISFLSSFFGIYICYNLFFLQVVCLVQNWLSFQPFLWF